jgi:hypothetical protein
MQEHRNKCVPSDENQGISDMRLRLVLRGFVCLPLYSGLSCCQDALLSHNGLSNARQSLHLQRPLRPQ